MLHFLVFDLKLNLKFLYRVTVLAYHIFVTLHLVSLMVQLSLQLHQFSLENPVLTLQVLAEQAEMTALTLQGVHNPLLLSLVLSILSVSYPLDFDPGPINGQHVRLLLFVKGKLEISVFPLKDFEMKHQIMQLALDTLHLGLLSPQVVSEHLVIGGQRSYLVLFGVQLSVELPIDLKLDHELLVPGGLLIAVNVGVRL